jgi:hypothetical protein
MHTSPSQLFHEPLRTTLWRTISIAIAVGAVIALSRRQLDIWPIAILLVLWPSFGGHWIELFFLNSLRSRLPISRPIQTLARLTTWFIGGTLLALGAAITAMLLTNWHPTRWPPWWLGGIAFIGLELIVHLVLQLRGNPSFLNGRG